MLAIGIESSCDDTSVSIVSDSREILANVISSQIDVHNVFGGVVPEIAARVHVDNIDYVYSAAIKQSGVCIDDIDCVAATCGPGLIGGVIVGATFAKAIASIIERPFYAINHIEAHALSSRLIYGDLKFPYLLLLASGGHCILAVVNGVKSFHILGRTLDDSIGEMFDKSAKMLGLKYPGGPEIEKNAKLGNDLRYKLPHPLCDKPTCDMSFSGLKTAVRNIIAKPDFLHTDVNDMCASIQKTICDVLYKKMLVALNQCNVTAVVMSGGVAANMSIRAKLQQLAKEYGVQFYAPPIRICTDNAAMIAWNAIELINAKSPHSNIDFKPTPRWPLSE